MRIGDVMTSDVPTVGPGDSVGEAARRMADAHVKALPVCDGDRVAGVITDWDVTRAVAAETDVARRPLSDYMSSDVVAVAPDTRLTEAAEVMAGPRVHHLVVEDGERFVGMVHLDVDFSEIGGLDAPIATFTARV